MQRILYIDRLGAFLRAVITEDGHAAECRIGADGGAGGLYRGVVQRVVRSINAAFVDIGLAQNAFLSLQDAHKNIKQGQVVLAQISKNMGGDKGPRVTLRPQIAGRLCVIHAHGQGQVYVSKKAENEARHTLALLGAQLCPEGFDLTLRTSAQSAEPAQIEREIAELSAEFESARAQFASALTPGQLDAHCGLPDQIARDFATPELTQVLCEASVLPLLQDAFTRRAPEYVHTLQSAPPPVVPAAAQKALDRACLPKVWLDGGGFCVFEQTQALMAIDVNTGKHTGTKAAAVTNRQAALEIARQIRLRDISGMIVVDFVDQGGDMRPLLLEALQQALRADRNPAQIVPEGPGGLVLLIRRCREPSWVTHMRTPCPACGR